MNKFYKIVYINILCISGSLFAAPNFEFWNKTDKPVYISVGDKDFSPYAKTFKVVNAGSWTNALQKEVPAGYDVNLKNETILLLSLTNPVAGTEIYQFVIAPGKTVYARIKEASGSLGFGPQTGPMLGFTGKTERGYALSNNFKASDFKSSKTKFQSATAAKLPEFKSPIVDPAVPVNKLTDIQKRSLQSELNILENSRTSFVKIILVEESRIASGRTRTGSLLDENDKPTTIEELKERLKESNNRIKEIRQQLGLPKDSFNTRV